MSIINKENEINENEVNKYVESIVRELGFKNCWIVMEEEGNYGAAFFMDTKGKNYYIKDEEKNTVIKHGVATKRSSLPKIIDKSTDEVVIALLNGGMSIKNIALIEAIDRAYDTSKWTIPDIAQGIHVRKQSDYKKRGTPLALTIGKLAQKRFKIPEENLDGMQVRFIKLKGESNYAVISDSDKIQDYPYDKEYYIDMLDRTLKNIGLSDFKPENRSAISTVQKKIEEAWGL